VEIAGGGITGYGQSEGALDALFEGLGESDGGHTETAVIDRLVWMLSGGDMVKGMELFRKATLRQALEWVLISAEYRD